MKKVRCIKVDYTSVLQWCCDGNKMILNYRSQWVTILLLIPTVNLQMLYPMAPMPPPMYAYPPPPPPPSPVAMAFPPSPPIAFQIVQIKTRKNATISGTIEKNGNKGINNRINGRSDDKTFEKTIGIAIPMAFPGPVQFAMPPPPAPLNLPAVIATSCMMTPRPRNCPVCPPCSCAPCTPSFYSNCSACHKKCRCREKRNSIKRKSKKSRKSGNSPLNTHVNPLKKRRRKSLKDESSDSSASSSGSAEWTSMERYKIKKAGHAKKKYFQRKGDFNFEMDGSEFAKPVLSYITRDGVVQIEKALSNDEAAELMNENNNYNTDKNNNRNMNGNNNYNSNNNKERVFQKVQVIAEEDADKKQRLKIISNIQNNYDMQNDISEKPQRRKVALKSQLMQHILKEGKKELIFKPPDDKRISNLSVSFQII